MPNFLPNIDLVHLVKMEGWTNALYLSSFTPTFSTFPVLIKFSLAEEEQVQ